jgi:16S rRNA processing protein RimM
METLPPRLAVGRVARAHGVRGRVLVAPYNAGSMGLEKVPRLWLQFKDGTQRLYQLAGAERVNLGYLVALKGVEDKDVADTLRGTEVLVARAELPALTDGEMYAVDLIGLRLTDAHGIERGVVEGIEEAGPNELLRLSTGALVPMAFVREVLPERIVVDAPEGLFELGE